MLPTYEAGSGIGFMSYKLKPEQERRIEWLGMMNDRHIILLANNDKLGLLELANDYEVRGMVNTANHIRIAVSRME